MMKVSEQERILAHALWEIRGLLSHCLGSNSEGDAAIREAALLAYALHNQALASVEGNSFEPSSAYSAIANVDRLLASNLVTRFARAGLEARN